MNIALSKVAYVSTLMMFVSIIAIAAVPSTNSNNNNGIIPEGNTNGVTTVGVEVKNTLMAMAAAAPAAPTQPAPAATPTATPVPPQVPPAIPETPIEQMPLPIVITGPDVPPTDGGNFPGMTPLAPPINLGVIPQLPPVGPIPVQPPPFVVQPVTIPTGTTPPPTKIKPLIPLINTMLENPPTPVPGIIIPNTLVQVQPPPSMPAGTPNIQSIWMQYNQNGLPVIMQIVMPNTMYTSYWWYNINFTYGPDGQIINVVIYVHYPGHPGVMITPPPVTPTPSSN